MRTVTQTKQRSGEGGIRALTSPYLSVSYRIHIANVAKLAIDATDHCTLLHAGTFLSSTRQSRRPPGHFIVAWSSVRLRNNKIVQVKMRAKVGFPTLDEIEALLMTSTELH